ncbi:hypothetical protein D046_3493C, partial [Vibrio parahaemolyticus V-223/04]
IAVGFMYRKMNWTV